MPSLRKIPFTKPIPSGAQVFTRKGKHLARWIDGKNRPREAELTEDGTRIRQLSRKWYGCYTDADGKERCVPLATDKTAAQQMLAELVRRAELGKIGIVDPFALHRKRPLSEHAADYEAYLLGKGDGRGHARDAAACVRRVAEGTGMVFLADLSLSRVQVFLADLAASRPVLPPLDPAKDSYTKAELAAVVGVKPHCIAPLVRRWKLPAEGQGRCRRFSRQTALALRDRLNQPIGPGTVNHYVRLLRGFTRWLVRDRRLPDDPLIALAPMHAAVDVRRQRRELTADELAALLEAARRSERTFRGLSGPDRFHLYAAACGTGFRASGLASLTPESFDLDAEIPTVTLSAQGNKSRKLKVQPLPPDVARLLADYLAGKPAGQPVWGGAWAATGRGAEMLRIDLDAAGIPYAVEGPDGPLYADFHALRHTYLTLGGRAGIDLRTLQELAGHSSPLLTARYSHCRLYDLAGAVEMLPNFLPSDRSGSEAGALRATGTDAASVPLSSHSLRPACAATEEKGLRVRTNEETTLSGAAPEGLPQELDSQRFEDKRLRMRTNEEGAPRRSRTDAPPIYYWAIHPNLDNGSPS
jgi:integrase